MGILLQRRNLRRQQQYFVVWRNAKNVQYPALLSLSLSQVSTTTIFLAPSSLTRKELTPKKKRLSSPQVLLVPLPMSSTTFSKSTHKNLSLQIHAMLSNLTFALCWSTLSVLEKKQKAFGPFRRRLLPMAPVFLPPTFGK